MTKEELITKIAKDSQMSEKEVSQVISLFIEQVNKKLQEGETVDIPGFGNFTMSENKEK